MQGRAIVIGGSIGGLFTAAFLKKLGWDVDIYERADAELSGRGAGIVTHDPLLEALEECGAGTKNLGVISKKRTSYDIDGNISQEFEFPQLVTSWDRLQSLTRATIADDKYHLDHMLDRFEETSDGIRAIFKNGLVAEGDILIGADGFRSAVRRQLFPDINPEYAGYVVWRGLANEADLPQDVQQGIFNEFGFFLPERDGEVLGYPIAGVDNDFRTGHRRYNWVWYRVVDPDKLRDMLTDENGVTHDLSIPPPLIRAPVIQALRDAAQSKLAMPFTQILDAVEAPFFTPIYDHASSSMVAGRIAMVGDAAFVARPHIGFGVTKAAEDARALAQALDAATNVEDALSSYNNKRIKKNRLAYERARYLGEYLMPTYRNEIEKAEWKLHHNITTIMRDTAVLNFY